MSLQPPAPAAAPPGKAWLERHRFLLGFILLSSFMGVSVGLAKVTTSLYAVHLGADPLRLGLIAAAQSIGILVMSLPVGLWVERFGPRPLFFTGTAAASLLYLGLSMFPDIDVLLISTALVSFAMPLRFVSLNTIFMAALERIGEARAGWYRGSHMVGMYLAGPMLAVAVVQAWGHAGSFRLITAMFALTLLLGPLVFTAEHHRRPATAPGGKEKVPVREALAGLLADPGGRRLAMQEAALNGLHMFYSFYIVVVALQRFGLDAQAAGSLVAVQGASFVTTLFVGGFVVSALGHRAVPVAATMIACAALLLGLAPQALWLWAGGALLGLGLGLLQTHNLTQFARLGARLGRGRVSGLSFVVGPGGGLLGGLLGGAPAAWFGLQPLFLVFVPVFLGLAWASVRTTHPAVAAPAAVGPSDPVAPGSTDHSSIATHPTR